MGTVTIVYGKSHICDGLVDWNIIAIFRDKKKAERWVEEKIKEWKCKREDIRIEVCKLMDE